MFSRQALREPAHPDQSRDEGPKGERGRAAQSK
jgi:hypothetical protein